MRDAMVRADPRPSPARAQRTRRSRILVLASGGADAADLSRRLAQGLPDVDVKELSDAGQALEELRSGRYEALLEVVVGPPLLVGSPRLSDEYLQQPLLALGVAQDGSSQLWQLVHREAIGADRADGETELAQALRKLLQHLPTSPTGPSSSSARGILDALEASTCAVDAQGLIVFRNRAWHEFAVANDGGLRESRPVNYLQLCDNVGQSDAGTSTRDRLDARLVAAGLREVLGGESERFEYEYPCHSQSEERWFSVRITPWADRAAGGAVLTHVDVTAMHQAQAALSHEVLHDDLTGLPNRTLLRDRLRQALLDARRRGTAVGVGFVDLDFFKRVNTSLGHRAGDAVLMQVGWRLSSSLRAGDTLAKFGGDEFVVVWRDLDEQIQARELAERLTTTLSAPFVVEDTPIFLTASVGVATSRDVQTGEQLIQAADTAMHQAKQRGRDRIEDYARDPDRAELERLGVESELRNAIEAEQLVLHYQPVIDLASGSVVGLEALVRWNHPVRGLLSPDQFIPVAESSGLIVPLGEWTLTQACTEIAAMQGPTAGMHVAVNLSTRQLTDHGVVAHVRHALGSSGLDPRLLVLEVTESAIMQDEDVAAVVLAELHGLGVQLAIDDFGTGFSSLLYLRRYPIGAIKIDRAFVAPLPDNSADHAICASVVALADAVHATSVAEGIETAEQYAALRGMGCRLGQGYLWSPAVPLGSIAEAIDRCRQVPRPAAVPRATQHRARTVVDATVRDRMVELQQAGASLHTIAAALNANGMQTARGTRWTAITVARHLAP